MWAEKLEEARPRLLELDSMTYTKPVREWCTTNWKSMVFYQAWGGIDSITNTKLVFINS